MASLFFFVLKLIKFEKKINSLLIIARVDTIIRKRRLRIIWMIKNIMNDKKIKLKKKNN